MISIIDKFLINESIFHWARNSITNILGKRQLNRLGRGQLTSDDKIENSEKIELQQAINWFAEPQAQIAIDEQQLIDIVKQTRLEIYEMEQAN